MNSARLLEMEMCYSKETIAEAVAASVIRNRIGRGLVKIMVYWSEEDPIQLLPQSSPDLAIFAVPELPGMNLDNRESVTACVSKWRKIDPETVPVSAKACSNYLNAYLARKDAVSRGFDMGIMMGTDGFLAEGSTESVFIVKDNVIKIPPLDRVLSSISRMSVLEMAHGMSLSTAVETLSLDDLNSADEIFLSHTGVKVEPVKQFEDKYLPAPGPISLQLMEQMEKILSFQDEAFMKWMQPMTV